MNSPRSSLAALLLVLAPSVAAAQAPLRLEVAAGADLLGDDAPGSPFGAYLAAGVRRRVGASPWELSAAVVHIGRNSRSAATRNHIGMTGGRLSFGFAMVRGVWSLYSNFGIGGYGVTSRTQSPGLPDDRDSGSVLGIDAVVGLRRGVATHELALETRLVQMQGPLDTRSNTLIVAGVVTW
ncbi:MAG: hypothetical protein V4558_08730 [Gemmatimonadota bacterium]